MINFIVRISTDVVSAVFRVVGKTILVKLTGYIQSYFIHLLENMLALCWRKYCLEDFEISGKKITIQEKTNDARGTGLIVWDGACVLGKYMEKKFGSTGLNGKTVIELGAGTGLAGICSSALGADVVFLTDLDYTLDNIRSNIESNKNFGKIICAELDWMNNDFLFLEKLKPDIVLMADVAWIVELVPPLVRTLRNLCEYCRPKELQIILTHQSRSTTTDFVLFSELEKLGFSVKHVDSKEFADCVPVYEITFIK